MLQEARLEHSITGGLFCAVLLAGRVAFLCPEDCLFLVTLVRAGEPKLEESHHLKVEQLGLCVVLLADLRKHQGVQG